MYILYMYVYLHLNQATLLESKEKFCLKKGMQNYQNECVNAFQRLIYLSVVCSVLKDPGNP